MDVTKSSYFNTFSRNIRRQGKDDKRSNDKYRPAWNILLIKVHSAKEFLGFPQILSPLKKSARLGITFIADKLYDLSDYLK